MDDWSFRYRFRLGAGMRIAVDSSECVLTDPETTPRVVLRSIALEDDDAPPISAQSTLVLRGSGFASPHEAQAGASRWLNALLLGFAANNLGADLGLRGPEPVAHLDLEHLASYATEESPVLLPDLNKLMIFETNPAPRFGKVDVGPQTINKSLNYLLNAVRLAYADETAVTERQLRAFSTCSSSFGLPPDARLITLISAIEMLLGHEPRMAEARAYVEEWIEAVKESELPADQKHSLRGSLNFMLNESIGQSLAKIAASLGEHTYQEETPAKFLKRCYTLRSQLVHGPELPDWFEVFLRGAELERLVGDLIASPLLAEFDAEPARTYVGSQIAPEWDGDTSSVPFIPVPIQFGPTESEPPGTPNR